VLCWGDNLGNGSTQESSVPVAVPGLSSGVAAIASGDGDTCALTTAGGVLCWGDNSYGQLGYDPSSPSSVPVAVSGLSSGVAAITVGFGYTCALTAAGGALCLGRNCYGQLGNDSITNSHVPAAVVEP
jgi:alpha-tubulin suppressor-like RCC1 family protein